MIDGNRFAPETGIPVARIEIPALGQEMVMPVARKVWRPIFVSIPAFCRAPADHVKGILPVEGVFGEDAGFAV